MDRFARFRSALPLFNVPRWRYMNYYRYHHRRRKYCTAIGQNVAKLQRWQRFLGGSLALN